MCRLAWRSAKQLQTSGCGRASERLAKSWSDFARICAYMGASVLVSIGPTRCPLREGAAQPAAQVSSLALIPHQLVERDRQIAHAFAGRMIDRIATAAAVRTMPISPTPLTPSGLISSLRRT